MKHLVIGDLHGNSCWKQVKPASWDKVVFIGDYVDHWNRPDDVITKNLLDVIALKEEYPEKVELLLGNHDVQYLYYPEFLCSGFRPQMQPLLSDIFRSNQHLFKVAYQCDKYLFSHAGVTNTWHTELMSSPVIREIKESATAFAELLNNAEQTGAGRELLFRAGRLRGGWGAGGIVWADKRELLRDALEGHHQVVGHTVTYDIETHEFKGKSVAFTDVLDYRVKFYEADC